MPPGARAAPRIIRNNSFKDRSSFFRSEADMAVNGVSGSTTTSGTDVQVVSPDATGLNSLTADSFLKILVAQLQNQDPTDPVNNQDLLNQMSSLRALQSNIELGSTLKSLSLTQQLASGTSYIGKTVSANVTDSSGNPQQISGAVDRVIVRNGSTVLGIGEQEVPINQVSEIQ
jgi:flagellar basal-body rod modification protein FlgD